MLRKIARELNKNVDIKSFGKRFICSTGILSKGADKSAATAADKPEERTVLVDKDKNVTMIGINRPQQRNAINSKTAIQLSEAFANFENDETSSVAVLYGVGGSFCAGYDILELGTEGDKISIDILMAHEGSVGPTRRHLKKPVVCGINGYCVANGLELSLMCDLRVMEEAAVLGFFNRRFGVPVIDGGTVRLPAIIGFSRALDLILTGRHVFAQEACEIGLVNRVVPTGNALIGAMELANTLAKFPQGALLHDRNSLYSAVFDASNFSQAIQNEVMYTSKEVIEQMQDGIKWFNKTYTSEAAESWLKRDKSMADWDDDDVVAAAEKKEQERQALKAAQIEKEKKLLEEKQKKPKEEQKPAK